VLGSYDGYNGPFQTVQPVEIIDFSVEAGAEYTHHLASNYNNCLGYVYAGDGSIGDDAVRKEYMVRLDASNPSRRDIRLIGGREGMKVILFSGVRLNQPVAWHGPFVMTTDEEIQATLNEYRTGNFLKVRSGWDFKRISTAPPDIQAEWRSCNSFSSEL
jgi:redox-sensitive bicupin YhaK (pirin superfamily)